MRFIVYGVGAIGGTAAAALALAGQEVIGIARGPQLDAIRAGGLLLRTPESAERARFPCHADPDEITFRDDDIILLTMKSQDTGAALQRLRAAGAKEQAIFCAQNGVANERLALRLFPNVYGLLVMMPADYSVPGEVVCYSMPKRGIFDLGRFPSGSDALTEAVAAAFDAAGIAAFAQADVMPGKYGKLLLNLRNVLEAALGVDVDDKRFYKIIRTEGEAAYSAAGIAWRDVGAADPRRKELMQMRDVAGATRSGGSSTQSLSRGAGSIETDYLNGEIVLLGRLHGVKTPANAYFCGLAQHLVAEKLPPGSISPSQIEDGLREAGVEVGN